MVYGIRFTRFTTLELWPIWYDFIGWAFHFLQTRSGCPVPVTVGELAAESGPLGCAGSVLQPRWQGEISSVKIFIIYPAVKHGNEKSFLDWHISSSHACIYINGKIIYKRGILPEGMQLFAKVCSRSCRFLELTEAQTGADRIKKFGVKLPNVVPGSCRNTSKWFWFEWRVFKLVDWLKSGRMDIIQP